MAACSRYRPRWHVSPRSQAEVTVEPFLWLQHVTLIFPRVFGHAFLSLLCSLLFFQVERWSAPVKAVALCEGRSRAPVKPLHCVKVGLELRGNPLHCVNNSWFSNSFYLRQLECFSHALVLGVVTPRQAPVQCCCQSSCFVTAGHTSGHLHYH